MRKLFNSFIVILGQLISRKFLSFILLAILSLTLKSSYAQSAQNQLISLWKKKYIVKFGTYKIWAPKFETAAIRKRGKGSRWMLINLSKYSTGIDLEKCKIIKESFPFLLDYFCKSKDTVSVIYNNPSPTSHLLTFKKYVNDSLTVSTDMALPDNYSINYKIDEYGCLPYAKDKKYHFLSRSSSNFLSILEPTKTIKFLSPINQKGICYYQTDDDLFTLYSMLDSSSIGINYKTIIPVNDTIFFVKLMDDHWQVLDAHAKPATILLTYDNVFAREFAGSGQQDNVIAKRNTKLFLLRLKNFTFSELPLDSAYDGELVSAKYFGTNTIYLKYTQSLWKQYDWTMSSDSKPISGNTLIPVFKDYILLQDTTNADKFRLLRFANSQAIDSMEINQKQKLAATGYADGDRYVLSVSIYHKDFSNNTDTGNCYLYLRNLKQTNHPGPSYTIPIQPSTQVLPYESILFFYDVDKWRLININDILQRNPTQQHKKIKLEDYFGRFNQLSYISLIPLSINNERYFSGVENLNGTEAEILIHYKKDRSLEEVK